MTLTAKSRVKVANLEASGTPVNKLDGPLGLDRCNRRINIFGNNISAVQQTASHVLAVSGVTFDLISNSNGEISSGEAAIQGEEGLKSLAPPYPPYIIWSSSC